MVTSVVNRARGIVSKAKKAGLLTPGNCCKTCGISRETSKSMLIEHHEDYSKPLDTITLCQSCHKKFHYSIGERRKPRKRGPKKKTKKRYESIQRYALKNPEMIQANIARVFRCNQATVSRALREFDSCGNIS